jgi:hypothetical protein
LTESNQCYKEQSHAVLDAFYKLEKVEEKLNYVDTNFSPIVTEAITELTNQHGLQREIDKDIFVEESSGYGAYYELVNGHRAIIRVMLYNNPKYIMQDYYWVHLHVYWLFLRLSSLILSVPFNQITLPSF